MFTLHPVLAADTVEIAAWELSSVRLMTDQNYPWLILVPTRDGISGLHQLSSDDSATLMREIRSASGALEKLYTPDRINVAALGNMVPQLHVHVIARLESDPAWPGPVWGAAPRKAYHADDLQRTISAFQQALKDTTA